MLLMGAITTAVAVLIQWLPSARSTEAGRITDTYWFATIISIVVVAVVFGVIAYAVLHFRAKPGDLSDGEPIHGNTTLEVVWTVIPFILVTALSIYSGIILHQNTQPVKDPIRVTVIGTQFAWTFKYPNGKVFPMLRLPVGRTAELTLTSVDVLHAFWVPEWFQKQDAIPGLPTKIGVTPNQEGRYPVVCVELCGIGHSVMRSEAIVMSSVAYDGWYKLASTPAPTGALTPEVGALATFTQNGCGACHTFPAANSTGKIGPDLDALKASAAKAGQPVEAFVKQAIVDPNAYLAPGYQANVMPGSFEQSIPKDKLDELVQYLVTNSK